ncbi:anaerobic ribonucleoside-triphosphate reductase activating protein [Candidatus Woesearchaeota archaeon]|nr:anaerobic ribonucleoside-triphosphate reductase activating protein [Candidatus Woesearchaeota archaeon]
MTSLLIKGLQKTTLIDYPGKVAATIFVGKCNFRCGFCYNKDLVVDYDKLPTLKEEEILDFLKSRKKWLDGVCISGGEPTMHKELPEFIKKIKEIGLLVKLDTNGVNPSMLRELIDKKLVDYVAMDIKGPLDKYSITAGVKVDKEKIKESVDILMKSNVDYEFRTTVVPGLLDNGDFEKIGKWLKGAKRYFLQQFKPDKKCIDKSYADKKPLPAGKLEEFKKILNPYFEEVGVRGV